MDKSLPRTIFLGMLHPNSFQNKKGHFETQIFHHPTLSNLRFQLNLRQWLEKMHAGF